MTTTTVARLYIIVRADLAPGLQAAQTAHAAFEFSSQHRDHTEQWLDISNNLIVVAVPNEQALLQLAAQAIQIPGTLVHEPDLDGQATALALAPTPAARRLCAQLPLALQEDPAS